jgi:hypothetical protein
MHGDSVCLAGGMPQVAQSTVGKFSSGFIGCISNLTLATDYKVDLMDEVRDGRNVEQCRPDRTITSNNNKIKAPTSKVEVRHG